MKNELIIVDDDHIHRKIVTIMVGHIDKTYSISECDNSKIGLAKLESLKDATHKIIVLLDINMPILGGWEFLEEIEKANFYNLSQLIIYMVSSSTDGSDILKAKNCQFVKGFYSKPLNIEDFRLILSH